jgi:hypothetical protein
MIMYVYPNCMKVQTTMFMPSRIGCTLSIKGLQVEY